MESRLPQAFDLLDGGKAWSKGRYARNKNGQACFIKSEDAVSFCGVGSLARAWYVEVTDLEDKGFGADLERLAKAAKAKGFNSASGLNDDAKTDFQLVTDWFAAAIEEKF